PPPPPTTSPAPNASEPGMRPAARLSATPIAVAPAPNTHQAMMRRDVIVSSGCWVCVTISTSDVGPGVCRALDARNLGARWPAPHPHWCARRSAQALNRDGGGSAQRPMCDKRTCSTVSGMDAVDRARGWLRVTAGDLLIE